MRLLLLLFAVTAHAAPPVQDWFPKPAPLPAPKGNIIRITTADQLARAAQNAKPGDTLLLADGHYDLPRTIDFHADNVTLRGESADPAKVILDGAKHKLGEGVSVSNCSGVTFADFTLRNITFNGFKINSDRFATAVTIHHCIIHNIWQRGVKGVSVRPADRERFRPADCRIQFCLFYNDRAKRWEDDSTDTAKTFNGNYVGGIDAMFPRAWIISDNVFLNIQGRTREARGAVFLWQEAENCIIERNIIIDCDSGICLGNSHKPADIPLHARNMIVRNNFITRSVENGILADYTKDCLILHNTVYDPSSRLKRGVRIVHDNDGLVVANNLLSGPLLRIETTSQITQKTNLAKDLTNHFTDPKSGNLHLKDALPEVTNAGTPYKAAEDDIDRQPRDQTPDLGADEWSK